MRPPRGTTLLVLLLMIYLVGLNGREAFRREGLPPVSVETEGAIRVLLEGDVPAPGIHQFSDGLDLRTVIGMTVPGVVVAQVGSVDLRSRLQDGARLSVKLNGNEIVDVSTGWMSAAQRVAIGVRLDPDRMSRQDWEFLPGVGPRLAAVIEDDRHKNGDFGSLDGLQRVRGIGRKSIEKWRCFF